LSRSSSQARPLPAGRALRRPAIPWLGATLALTLAIGSGVLLAQLLMDPPAGDLRALAAYFALSGVATTAVGWALLRTADRAIEIGIQTKAFLGSIIAIAVALLNIFIVAQLMFISTSHDLKLLAAITVFSAIVTGFFSLWVASTVAARIGVASDAVRALARGDLSTRVEVWGGDEVSRLAADVNTLAERLQAAEEQRRALDRERKELTTAISHDLRTPLASLRAMIEALEDGVVSDPAEVRRYHGTMRREIERVGRMIDDLFVLAQIDAGALTLQRHPVDIREIAADVVDAMQPQASRAGIALALASSPEIPALELDGSRMERAVANLVRNAIEHTPAGGHVDLEISPSGGGIILAVRDTGEGIDPEELPRIWDRFYRAERSRHRGAKGADGAGLGLAIVRGIVEAHGGTVRAESERGRGASFTITLPS